jgi:hypothetical protein
MYFDVLGKIKEKERMNERTSVSVNIKRMPKKGMLPHKLYKFSLKIKWIKLVLGLTTKTVTQLHLENVNFLERCKELVYYEGGQFLQFAVISVDSV